MMYKNTIILFFIFLFSFFLFWISDSKIGFLANVMSIQDLEVIKKNKWDIAYKLENNFLNVYLNGEKKYDHVSFEIFYDNKNVYLALEGIEKPGLVNIFSIEDGILSIKVSLLEDISIENSILNIPFDGNEPSLALVNAKGFILDKEFDLSIGNLTYKFVHN